MFAGTPLEATSILEVQARLHHPTIALQLPPGQWSCRWGQTFNK